MTPILLSALLTIGTTVPDANVAVETTQTLTVYELPALRVPNAAMTVVALPRGGRVNVREVWEYRRGRPVRLESLELYVERRKSWRRWE